MGFPFELFYDLVCIDTSLSINILDLGETNMFECVTFLESNFF